MKIERITSPPAPPPFDPITITVETALEASVLRALVSDASNVREKANEAALAGREWLALPTAFDRSQANTVLQDLKRGLRQVGIPG